MGSFEQLELADAETQQLDIDDGGDRVFIPGGGRAPIEILSPQQPTDFVMASLGKTINLINATKPSDYKKKVQVVKSSYIKSTAINKVDIRQFTSQEMVAASFTTISTSIASVFGVKANDRIPHDGFVEGFSNDYTANLSGEMTIEIFRFYSYYSKSYINFSLSLNNYSIPSLYKTQLDSSYISALDSLKNNTMTYESFFDTYGTHLIANAYYGGTMELLHTITSNKYVDSSLSSQLQQSCSLEFTNVAQGGLFGSNSFIMSADLASKVYKRVSKAIVRGGSVYDPLDSNDQNQYNSWLASLESNPGLIGFANDGLIPIWDFLPSGYESMKDPMKAQCTQLMQVGMSF